MATAILERTASVEKQSASWEAWITRLTWATVVIGISWRVGRYLCQFPIWGDEAHIAVNFPFRDFWGMTHKLDYGQVAPVLFLWIEWIAFHLLGPSELALRIFPLLAGIAGLLLFQRFCRLTMPSSAACLAVGMLAVSYYPVRHATEIKPYSFDLLFAVALMIPAVRWTREPEKIGWLVLLSALTPIAVAGSYPAVFVGGAISLYLLPGVWKASWRARSWYVVFNLAMVTTFAAHIFLVGGEQLDREAGTVAEDLHRYWVDWFPPANLVHLPLWLLKAHTGNMLAYPVGGPGWGSTLTFLWVAAGCWALWKTRRTDLLVLCLVPFALSLVAAFAHKYPYGGSARLAQHLAPAICMLAGFGIVWFASWLPRHDWQRNWIVLFLVGFGVLGLGGLAYSFVKPYKMLGDERIREMGNDIKRFAKPGDTIIVHNPHSMVRPNFVWYLWLTGCPVVWNGEANWTEIDSHKAGVWSIHLRLDEASRPSQSDLFMAPSDVRRRLADQRSYVFPADSKDVPLQYCEVFRWDNE